MPWLDAARAREVGRRRRHTDSLLDLDASVARDGAGIMLHLGARSIGHAIAAARLLFAQAHLAQQTRQGRVGNLYAFFFDQLLVHALRPAMAFPIQPLEQFGLNADLVLAAIGGHLPLLLEDRAHCVAAELQTARDLAYAHALLVE